MELFSPLKLRSVMKQGLAVKMTPIASMGRGNRKTFPVKNRAGNKLYKMNLSDWQNS